MGDLSDRFGALMARMAKGDAELFRTVGEQNAAIRELVEELAPAPPAEALAALQAAPQSLLPPEQCQPKALKARFATAAAEVQVPPTRKAGLFPGKQLQGHFLPQILVIMGSGCFGVNFVGNVSDTHGLGFLRYLLCFSRFKWCGIF
jgi:hypothetical protein